MAALSSSGEATGRQAVAERKEEFFFNSLSSLKLEWAASGDNNSDS